MRLPKLNLRDLFWLMAVLAILFAWERDHRRLLGRLRWLEVKAGVKPVFDGGGTYVTHAERGKMAPAKPN